MTQRGLAAVGQTVKLPVKVLCLGKPMKQDLRQNNLGKPTSSPRAFLEEDVIQTE